MRVSNTPPNDETADVINVRMGKGNGLDPETDREVTSAAIQTSQALQAQPVQQVTGGAVEGSVGQVVGIPSGTQYVYVPANNVVYPIDLNIVTSFAVDKIDSSGSAISAEACILSGKIVADQYNIMGSGTDTILVYDDTSNNVVFYNVSSGTAQSFSTSPAPTSWRNMSVHNGYIVIGKNGYNFSGGTSTVVGVKVGATITNVTLNPDSGTFPTYNSWQLHTTGASANGNNIVAVWFASVSGSGQRLVVTEYTSSGTLLGSKSYTTGLNSARAAVVENGYVLASCDNFIVATSTDYTATAWGAFPLPSAGQPCMTMGATGIGWATTINGTNTDLYRLDMSTGVSTVFSAALTNKISIDIAGPDTPNLGLAYVSDTKVAICGTYIDTSANTQTPVYILAVYSPGPPATVTLNITQYTTYTKPWTAGSAATVFSAFPCLVNGDVVFSIQSGYTSTSSGYADAIYRVTA